MARVAAVHAVGDGVVGVDVVFGDPHRHVGEIHASSKLLPEILHIADESGNGGKKHHVGALLIAGRIEMRGGHVDLGVNAS